MKNELLVDKNTPEIQVIFSISGNLTISDIEEIYHMLDIKSAKIFKYGDLLEYGGVNKINSIEISTIEIKTYEIEEEVLKIISLLKNKKNILCNMYKVFNGMSICLSIVATINNGYTPVFYLSEEIIKFFADIHTSIDVDLYVNSFTINN